MKVWTVTYNDDSGVHSTVHLTVEEADAAALEWIQHYRPSFPEVDFDQTWADVQSDLCEESGYMDSVSVVEHDLDLTVNHAWKVCKDGPGAFGNLYGTDELFTIMDGWGDADNLYDHDGRYFSSANPDDRAALTAWCEAEGPVLEDQISNLVCENLPTRREAYDALSEKLAEAAKQEKAA